MSSERIAVPDDARVTGARCLASGAETVRAALRARELDLVREQGLRAAREELGAALDRAVERLAAFEDEARASLARTAVELALEIARLLLRTEIGRGNHDLERIVRDALSEAAVGRGPCVVHLNPADHARLSGVRFRSGTRLAPDEGVSPGDVHVETPLGLLVRDLDGALESIERRLHEALP